jgi:NAD(P)-dependent dehydrogenase (short-subunit alcohol dehydrogenase family)
MAPLVPWPDTAPYSLAKAAQNHLVETLAFEYRNDGITVNAVLPACIHTGFLDAMAATKKNRSVADYTKVRADAHPVQRNGTPEEVASAIVYLAGTATFTTGELLKCDGGLHLANWFNQPRLLAEYQGK